MRLKKLKKHSRSASGMMGRMFVERLELGLLIDCNQKHSDGKSRAKIAAPKGLRKCG